MQSADGRGRTLWEILTGRNKRDMTPLELQYHNPLSAKIGCTIQFDHQPEIRGINFVIEKIAVFETRIGRKKFHHTDYFLRGTSLETEGFVRMRLRLIDDENAANQLGCRIQLLYIFQEVGWDDGLYNMLCENGDHDDAVDEPGEITFKVNYDDEGNELEQPKRYWRIEGVPEPYCARVTLLVDTDKNGQIDDEELEHFSVTYWDFSRITDDPQTQQDITEFLTAEMDDESKFFTFLRGIELQPFQITVF